MNSKSLSDGRLGPFRFHQFHVDVARNSTDDFNPLHDPNKWRSIPGNPFGRTLVSVFQLECLVEFLLRRGRGRTAWKIADRNGLRFCNYDFAFARPLRVNETFFVNIRPANNRFNRDVNLVSHVWVGKKQKTGLAGSVRLSERALNLSDERVPEVVNLDQSSDITYVPDTSYFLKRKYLSTANAKNFISSSLADQAFYFDEPVGRVRFPYVVPVSYISSALYEQGAADNIDFRLEPMIYARHRVSVDRLLADELSSNDRLHLLIKGPEISLPSKGLGQLQVPAHHYSCFGLVWDNQVLFRAEIVLIRLYRGNRRTEG